MRPYLERKQKKKIKSSQTMYFMSAK